MCDCSTISWWLAGWRALHFVACLLPVGLFAFHFFVAAPVFGAGSGPSRATIRCVFVSLIAGLVSGIAWLLIIAGNIGDVTPMHALRDGIATAVLNETHFGTAWRVRAVFWLVATAATILMLLQKRPSATIAWICFSASAAFLGGLAWAGHGLDGDGNAGRFHLIADMLHLLAGGVWPFGLVPFAAALLKLHREASQPRWIVVGALTRRFSAIAMSCVALLTATGLVNCWFMLPSVWSLWRDGYGRTLSLKIILFAAMIAFAAINRLLLKPRLVAGNDVSAIALQLRRNVLVELMLGMAIVFIVALLGLLPPPMP